MICPKCGTNNPDNMKFCGNCTAFLTDQPVKAKTTNAGDQVKGIFALIVIVFLIWGGIKIWNFFSFDDSVSNTVQSTTTTGINAEEFDALLKNNINLVDKESKLIGDVSTDVDFGVGSARIYLSDKGLDSWLTSSDYNKKDFIKTLWSMAAKAGSDSQYGNKNDLALVMLYLYSSSSVKLGEVSAYGEITLK